MSSILKFDDESFEHRHIDDVKRIQKVLKKNNYLLPLSTCSILWQEYSDLHCAGWLGLSDDDNELFQILKKFNNILQ